MTKDFDVLAWIREVRDKNAEAVKGMSAQQIVARTKEATKDIVEKMRAQGTVIRDAGDWRRRPVNKNQGN